jgi:hypothetical protein
MRALQPQEIGRVAGIALLAATTGSIVFLTSELVRPAVGTAPSGFWYLLVFPMLLVAVPTSMVVGAVVHLVVRETSIPRLVLLPVFITLGLLVGKLVSGQWYGTFLLSALISGFAWGLYCFGPLKLWRVGLGTSQ